MSGVFIHQGVFAIVTFDCSIPMWKLVTGEPYAGKSHVRFGGRGGAEPSLSIPMRALPANYKSVRFSVTVSILTLHIERGVGPAMLLIGFEFFEYFVG